MSTYKYPKYQDRLSLSNKLRRLLWNTIWLIAFRPFDLPVFHSWKRFVLRLFGAQIGNGSIVHASVKIWAPWNLEIGEQTVIARNVVCYNPDKVVLGDRVSISQRAYLCTASHDYTDKAHPLITKPIVINDFCWVATDAFVSMGVVINEGSIVGARAVVTNDIEPWSIVAGNPAKIVKNRVFKTP